MKTLVHGSKISMTFQDGTNIFKDVSFSIVEKQKIGIVGRNGSGKSSLLKIIEGKLRQTKGSVERNCSIYYLPQIDLEQYSSKEPLHNHLSKILEDWWKVFNILESEFNTKLDENITINSLSGGEIVKLNLAICQAIDPDLILLDEPTNHLDIKSSDILSNYITKSNKTIVIVSHDKNFLDLCVNSIWEIDKKQLNVYGGNYSEYKRQKIALLKTKEKQYIVANKAVNRAKRNLVRVNIKSEKEIKKGKALIHAHDRSISRIQRGNLAIAAETSANKVKKTIFDRIENKSEIANEYKEELPKVAYFNLNSNKVPTQSLIVEISNSDLLLPNKEILIKDVNLKIYFGDRIAIAGQNGSGKTSLVRNFKENNKNTPLLNQQPKLKDNAKIVFIDQKYDLVEPNKTCIENVSFMNPELKTEQIRKKLGSLLFSDEREINKFANELSGGEIARLCFAMATATNIDLLVLDEPTNNLDIETIDAITKALKNFKGAILVISHNVSFLSEIGVTKIYKIENKKFNSYDITQKKMDEIYEILK